MRFSKKEALQQDFYFKLFDGDNGDTICRSDNLNDVKKEAYLYDDDCDGDCVLACIKYKVIDDGEKRKGVRIAQYNPYTKKMIFEY